jgi:hypothetical protein
MTEEMKEFRTQLSQVDGACTELESLRGQVDEWNDEDLSDELSDLLYQLESVITNIQESEGWI